MRIGSLDLNIGANQMKVVIEYCEFEFKMRILV